MTTVISELIAERDALVAELERVKAERDHLMKRAGARVHENVHAETQARLDKALAALREIEDWPHKIHKANDIAYLPHHIYEIARTAIAEIEGEYDDIPGAGQRTC